MQGKPSSSAAWPASSSSKDSVAGADIETGWQEIMSERWSEEYTGLSMS